MDPTLSIDVKDCLARSGDAWPTALLATKSSDDLRKLWFVLLKEKNFLLTERSAFRQMGQPQKAHGRLKKVRVSMKRLLRVITRREIHEQVVRGKEILEAQTTRESLETQRFQVEETIKEYQHKLGRLGVAQDSLQRTMWTNALLAAAQRHESLLLKLKPLRMVALQAVAPNWRYSRRYSDIPGHMSWKPVYIKALAHRHKLIPKRY